MVRSGFLMVTHQKFVTARRGSIRIQAEHLSSAWRLPSTNAYHGLRWERRNYHHDHWDAGAVASDWYTRTAIAHLYGIIEAAVLTTSDAK